MTGIVALYIFMLAAFTGYEIIAKVPVILHTPLMSGSNFVHGIVLVGAMVALGGARHAARESHRLRRRAAGRRQRRRRLRRHRTHARDVQVLRRAQEDRRRSLMDSALSQPGFFSPRLLIDISYFLTAALFILGLKRMSSPVTARSGIVWAGAGMVVATLVTFLYPGMSNYELIIAAIVVGSLVAWWSGKRVAMTDMPQMIALYNGMGGGAAAAIAAVELYRAALGQRAGAPVTHSSVVHVARGGRRHHRRHLVQR